MYETLISESVTQMNKGKKDYSFYSFRKNSHYIQKYNAVFLLCIIYKWELELNEIKCEKLKLSDNRR